MQYTADCFAELLNLDSDAGHQQVWESDYVS